MKRKDFLKSISAIYGLSFLLAPLNKSTLLLTGFRHNYRKYPYAIFGGQAGENISYGDLCYWRSYDKYYRVTNTDTGSGFPISVALEPIEANTVGQFSPNWACTPNMYLHHIKGGLR